MCHWSPTSGLRAQIVIAAAVFSVVFVTTMTLLWLEFGIIDKPTYITVMLAVLGPVLGAVLGAELYEFLLATAMDMGLV